jgi:predicted small lipoprotein YifL
MFFRADHFRSTILAVLALGLLVAAPGCGKKGPLFLPDEPKQQQKLPDEPKRPPEGAPTLPSK